MPDSNIYSMNGSASGMGSPDNNSLIARIARLEDSAPYILRGNSFARQGRSQFSPIDSSGVVDGKINLATSAGISFQGILAPNVIDGQFTVASPSDSTATIYWDGTNSSRVFLIRRADGTSTTIPGNNLTITGLTHDVKYEVLPFWVPFNQCGLGFAPGTVGTPVIAFASTDSDTLVAQGVAAQSLAGREPIGTVSWTQPASGGSSGAGTPTAPPTRQPGTCVKLGTHIEPLGNPRPSEIEEHLHKESRWMHIETAVGLVLDCTLNHNIYHAVNGRVEAQTIQEGDLLITRTGEQKVIRAEQFIRDCTKVELKMKTGHLFWANGILSHNSKIQLPQL